MSTLTAERIAELRRLLAEATPGKWSRHLYGSSGSVKTPDAFVFCDDGDDVRPADIELIVAAHNALPELLDAAERVIALEAACARKDSLPGVQNSGFCQAEVGKR